MRGQRQSRLAAVTADARDQEDRCEPAGRCGGWGLVVMRWPGTCSSPVEDRQVRPRLGVWPEPHPPQLLRSCLSTVPPIRLHSPGPHTHWPPGHVLNVASGSVEPGASLVGSGTASGPREEAPGPEQRFQGLSERLMMRALGPLRALLLCTWSRWSWGPRWPGSAALLKCPPQPGGLRAPHPTAGPSWVPRPVLVEGLGISPARATSLQLGLGIPGRPQALSPVL